MKKTALILLACMLAVSPAYARGWHGGHHHHHIGHHIGGAVLGTFAGLALADAIVSSTRPRVVHVAQPRVYIAEPENKCYTVVSRKRGTVTRQCVSDTGNDDIIYVD